MSSRAEPNGLEPSQSPTYHYGMRRGFYLLMMLVLVLRGLTGTAMAAGVLPALGSMQASATVSAVSGIHGALGHRGHPAGQQHAHGHEHDGAHHAAMDAQTQVHAQAAHAAGAPCNGVHHAGCGTTPDGIATASTHHHGESTCSVCEICHSAMLALPAAHTRTAARAGTLLPDASAQFHSATAALALEPPIS